MGDRANVAVVQNGDKSLVYLYTHWGGYDLPFVVQAALQKKWRWDDGPYLTRIIFDEMSDKSHGTETGYGIATYRPDNEHAVIVVNAETQRVGFAREGEEPQCYTSWSFDEYIALSQDEIQREYRKGR